MPLEIGFVLHKRCCFVRAVCLQRGKEIKEQKAKMRRPAARAGGVKRGSPAAKLGEGRGFFTGIIAPQK